MKYARGGKEAFVIRKSVWVNERHYTPQAETTQKEALARVQREMITKMH